MHRLMNVMMHWINGLTHSILADITNIKIIYVFDSILLLLLSNNSRDVENYSLIDQNPYFPSMDGTKIIPGSAKL